MNTRLPKRVLICGLGSIGRRYCRLIHQFWPSIELSSLRSRSDHSKKKVGEEKYLTHCFEEINDAIAWNPNAAVIATPASFHIEQSILLAKAMIPLLIEKPVGTGLESSDLKEKLLFLSKSVPIYVGYVLRHDPCASMIRKQMLSEKLGCLMSADFYCGSWLPDWRPGQDYRDSVSALRCLGGGALLELSHELDMASWCLGNLKPITAYLRNSGILEIDVEDQACLVFLDTRGCPISIRLELCTNPSKRTISLRFTNGELIWDLIQGVVYQHEKENLSVFRVGINSDERFLRQLVSFWDLPQPGNTALCSLAEGLDILDLVVRIRKLAFDTGVAF